MIIFHYSSKCMYDFFFLSNLGTWAGKRQRTQHRRYSVYGGKQTLKGGRCITTAFLLLFCPFFSFLFFVYPFSSPSFYFSRGNPDALMGQGFASQDGW